MKGIPIYSIMSLGECALCKHAQSGNFLNLENISIIAICSGNVPVLTKDSNGPKSLHTFLGNVGLFVLSFYGPVNPIGSCRVRSVYLTTRLLGRLSPLSG